MSQLDTHLFFDGACAEAMRFYERVLGGTLETMATFADAPAAKLGTSSAPMRIAHARLRVDGRTLLAADVPPGEPYAGMHGFSISLVYASVMRARRVWEALAEGGEVHTPLQGAAWVEAFGMLVDRYGTPWTISAGVASA